MSDLAAPGPRHWAAARRILHAANADGLPGVTWEADDLDPVDDTPRVLWALALMVREATGAHSRRRKDNLVFTYPEARAARNRWRRGARDLEAVAGKRAYDRMGAAMRRADRLRAAAAADDPAATHDPLFDVAHLTDTAADDRGVRRAS